MSEKQDFNDPLAAATERHNDIDPATPASSPRHLTAYLWGLLTLLLGLAVTLVVHDQQAQRHEAERTFVRNELANKSYAALQAKLHSAEALLRAVQTLFLASDEVTATEFGSLYLNMRPREQFPSLLALAYAQREVRPDGEHYVNRWVGPLPGNEAVVGLDVAAQPRNLAGLLASRDSDRIALSAPFRPM